MPGTRWRLAVAASLLVSAAGACAAAEGPEAVLAAFFREDDAARRRALAEQFAAVAPQDLADLKRMLHRAALRPKLEPGRHTFRTPGDSVVPPVQYVLRVPPGYEANAPEGWPLVIACHGTGGSGQGQIAMTEALLGPDAGKYLVACPDAPEGGVYKVSRTMTEYPVRVLEDVRRRANVDSDRAALVGLSKGGYTTWGTALFSPGEWAAAVPMASWPLTEARSAGAILYLQNVAGLAIQAHWGADDIEPGQKEGINTLSREAAAELRRLGAKGFEGIEYAGQGHGLDLRADRIRAILASARRDPFPEQFQMLFHHVWQGRAYFVRATQAAAEEFDFDKPRVIKVASRAELDRAKRDLYRRHGFELDVRLRPDKNAIYVQARNLREIEVELPAGRLDFTKPIQVNVAARPRVNETRKIDYAELLERARETHDFERLIAGRVRLSVAP